ncbi:hypothetical protein AMAG_13697 [Allomyces macrogynus ATCC 38327]|uniref:Fumarylacetoacetase n=1 Tax=Allomyces macrogynus (strain ATCC 38327) TaxID=578462 RepID=A0A0L0T421_ALLM3|nr:hypothetical protein AMAG_13697 [Allomyces macrogynus ATCC 38327]|eukprot:KNE69324.1 hypothetical protein AMAG_13697 [Allomyces macrogynus ATCC 38327]
MRLQFDLDLTDIQSSLYLATLHGHVCILDWWQDNAPDDMPLYLSWNLIYAATKCTTGEPDVLDWWLASRWLVPEYLSDYTFGDALQVAARVGHVRILDYAANQSYLRVPVEHLDGLDGPSRAGQVAVLEWWVKSGWTVMYSVEAIVGAAEEGRLDVLEWWARSGLEIKLPRDWDAFIARIKDPAVEPTPLPYLRDTSKAAYDIRLQVQIKPAGKQEFATVTDSNLKYMYWSFKQQLVHHAVNGPTTSSLGRAVPSAHGSEV